MENNSKNDSIEDDEQKMEFLSQFFDNEEESQKEANGITAKKDNKNKKTNRKHKLKRNNKHIKYSNIKDDYANIPDEPGLWLISFIIFCLMGYLFDLQLIYLTPVIFVAFIIYLLGKTTFQRNKILKRLNIFLPLTITPKVNSSAQQQNRILYLDDLEHPLLAI